MTSKPPDICQGSVVVPTAGRGYGRAMMIVGICDNAARPEVMIADGKTRPLERPKRKNLAHLRVLRPGTPELAAELSRGMTNRRLRELLLPFAEEAAVAAGRNATEK